MRIVLLLALIVTAGIIFLTIRCISLTKRMRGLNRPELWLPRRERQDYARELLARERDIYETSRQEALVALLRDELEGKP
jgi:hypothetical protein